MKLPFFPLQSIFFPGETVPLHIFEPRYKQLILDCRQDAMTFGIPVFLGNTMEYGTEVQLVEVVNTYENGEMDIVGVARQVFRVITFEDRMGNKLYAGGLVEFLEYDYDAEEAYKNRIILKIQELYGIMDVPFATINIKAYNSFVLAHKIGLSFEQEYELLKMSKEMERLSFINKHLINTISILSQVERTKKAIELNGHFKNFDPLDFKGIEVQQ